jgi:hypothetical protein
MTLAEWVAWLGSDDNLAPAYASTCAAKFFEAGKGEPALWLMANHGMMNTPDLSRLLRAKVKLRIVCDPRFGWAEMEAAAALPSPAPRFRVAAADALSRCMFVQLLDGADEWTRHRRKDFIRVAEQAETTLAGLEGLDAALATLPSLEDCRPPLLTGLAEQLRALATTARQQADACGASPGRPRSYFVFEHLSCCLGDVFEGATGRRATVNWDPIESRYQGLFLEMMEAALPKLSKIFSEAGCPLAYPKTEPARGVFLARTLRRFRRSKLLPTERQF